MKVYHFVLCLLAAALLQTGCNKSSPTTRDTGDDPQIGEMVNVAMKEMETQEVYAGPPAVGLFMDNDGVPDIFMVEEQDLSGDDTLREKFRLHSLIRCLKVVEPEGAQPRQIRGALKDYQECKARAVDRIKAIYRNLQASYKEKYIVIYRKYQSGELSEREFNKMVTELRISFKREMTALRLKEKLDEALSGCFRSLLSDIHSILNTEQWGSFKRCFLSH